KITLCMAMQGLKKTKTVCIATISGILANLILDIPFMLLLYYIGLQEYCYIGAMIATAVGQSTCIFIILRNLKKTLGFNYKSVLKPFIKTFYPTLIMGVAVYLLNFFFPVSPFRSVSQIIHLCVYAGIGGIIYFVMIYFNGALADVFGQNAIDKILRKLKIKKAK
ncbi:MAG: polysaccharide biosynthesis C-terminal domain-containing protein, partial [Clostridia bacterium]|nr:polysaccharide biosynthesis C-terminal domain-containing protein [Clostridia bacterium]